MSGSYFTIRHFFIITFGFLIVIVYICYMKKVYVEIKDGFPMNVDVQNAIDGFDYLGYNPNTFTYLDVLTGNLDYKALHSPVIGSIDAMTKLFKRIKKLPEPIDFPKEIFINPEIIKRKIKIIPLKDAMEEFKENENPVFIKPVQTKLFDGIPVTKIHHLNYLRYLENPDVYVSEMIDIVSEHRAYIYKDEVKYCCSYSGDFRKNPDYTYIEKIMELYKSSPIAYTIDVAVLKDGSTELIEVNDMWAIGSYGLYCMDYAEMLFERYKQIMGWEQE